MIFLSGTYGQNFFLVSAIKYSVVVENVAMKTFKPLLNFKMITLPMLSVM